MHATAELHRAGQSLWLDNITRGLLDDGTLARYAAALAVTGLTSNPTIYDRAIGGSDAYDASIRAGLEAGESHESIFFGLALEDLRRAADLFRPVFERTHGVDGYVSLEVSPLLADDADATIEQAARLHRAGSRPNLLIKIPGTAAGLRAIEETVLAGVPVNVTLLFSAEQYLAAAEAYTRGIERRVEAGLDPRVGSVASLFVSRWDTAVAGRLPEDLKLQLGILAARRAYRAYRRLLDSDRWQRLLNEGALPQRLLWASTGTKDPAASDVLYVEALAAPHTVNTMPDETLLAFADHGNVARLLSTEEDEADAALGRIEASGIDVAALAQELQRVGAEAFRRSWASLLERIEARAAAVAAA
jgi:transaldolase